MTDGRQAARLPTAPERALYRAITDAGGRILFREVAEQDLPQAVRLIELGLIVHHIEDDSLIAVNPASVTEHLSSDLRNAGTDMLSEADRIAADLEGLVRAFHAVPRQTRNVNVVQQVDSLEHIRHRILQLEAELKEEALAAQPGGARPKAHLEQASGRLRRFLERGGTARTIYQPGARTDPDTAEYCARASGWGEQIRILDEPYTRMFVFDRRAVVIPASSDNRSAAFIEDPAVVSALVAVFERDWERAERVRWQSPAAESTERPVHDHVGALLAKGLTQRSIAARLGLSERTVAGHIARLRELYDAQTLFQLGRLMRDGCPGEPDAGPIGRGDRISGSRAG